MGRQQGRSGGNATTARPVAEPVRGRGGRQGGGGAGFNTGEGNDEDGAVHGWLDYACLCKAEATTEATR
jgi:hypothetical protein